MKHHRRSHYPTVSFRSKFNLLSRMQQPFDRLSGDGSGTARARIGTGIFPRINLTEEVDQC